MLSLELKGKEKGGRRENENSAMRWLSFSLVKNIESIYYLCVLIAFLDASQA
jgi:hypothetical protein